MSTVEKVFKILELLGSGPHSFTEIQKRLQLPKSTAWSLLSRMESSGSIEKDETGKYQLGHLILRLGLAMYNNLNVKIQAEPIMAKMAQETNEISHLCILDKSRMDVVYIAKIEGPSSIHIKTSVGSSNPSYCTAAGKVFLSHLSHRDLEDYLQNITLISYTSNTITKKEDLMLELADVREKGFAIDRGEHIEYSTGISAPVLDHQGICIAALSITGFTERMLEQQESFIQLVKQYASELSHLMGYPHK
ncbi:DNA-binding IclR family transcriptional regulator [Ammoniphilus resinae]|uniref:DNA-binding IclR family transcriptional regulator n=2 Tax=Ammoniphilus resinae TaxID=861532 RepID=A0ABS4GMC6_9BACL|nr:DNA-binding IclR family transcriptional regulator [Ammoniphilus resinae]